VTRPDTLPDDLRRPAYGATTLADVLPSVAACLGVGGPDPLGLTEVLRGARRVAVLLVDGLGADLVRAHPDLAACRRAATACSASSPTSPGRTGH
jgi:hypothetical protein